MWIVVSWTLITLLTEIRDTFLKVKKYSFLLADPNTPECQKKKMGLQVFIHTQRKSWGQELSKYRDIRKTYSSAQGWVAEPNKHLGWKGLLKSPGPMQDELLCLSVLLSLLPFHNLQKKEVLQSLQTTCFSTFY